MPETKTPNTVRGILREHNVLNGFRFVLIEFGLMFLLTAFLGAAEAWRGNGLWAVFYLGVATNSAAVCASVIFQMRRGDRSYSIADSYVGAGRERTRREHPNLERRTLALTALILIPFLLTLLLLRERPRR